MSRKKHIDTLRDGEPEPAREVAPAERGSEKAWQAALRPRTFDEYIGQRDLIDNLKISVRAAKQNGWALDHFLFAGPPGLGKTTLAHVIANELGVNLHVSSGPAIDHKGMLASLLTSLGEVMSALVGMGWRPVEAEQAVGDLAIEEGATIEALLRQALRSMPR